jgi:drug/metabolite transporter (DMT)-like permease
MAALRGKALVAYLLVCTLWGSTYLAIRIGVAHLPPFLFAGVRFLVAGLLLGAIVLSLGIRLPSRARDWRTLAITGVFLLCGANAILVWSEQFMDSGVASVFVAAMPLWAAFFDAVVPGGKTPLTWRIGVGLGIGFLGARCSRGSRRTSSPPPTCAAPSPSRSAAPAGRWAASTGSETPPT